MIGASWDGTCRRSICAPQPRTWLVTRYATAAPASGTTGAIGDLKIRPTRSAMTTTVTSSSASSAFSMRFPSLICAGSGPVTPTVAPGGRGADAA